MIWALPVLDQQSALLGFWLGVAAVGVLRAAWSGVVEAAAAERGLMPQRPEAEGAAPAASDVYMPPAVRPRVEVVELEGLGGFLEDSASTNYEFAGVASIGGRPHQVVVFYDPMGAPP